MLTSSSKKTILITAASAVILIFSACHNGKNGGNGYNSPTAAACSCEANWFPHATTPNTIDGKGGPFDIPLTGSTTNCQFHQWSWQKFLWLTRPMTNGHAFFQDSLIQVDPDLIPVPSHSNIPLVLSDTKQAGSKGDLITNPAYNGTAYKVYYSIYVNKTLKHAADSFKKVIDTTTSLLNNSLNFPNGSLELKVSWVNIAAIPAAEQGNYYQANSTIMTVPSPGDTVYTTTTVALLGMHVVGRVINHPEFIWATFEHHGMQPYYNWANATDSSDASATAANDKLLFAKGSATTMSGITWDTTTKQADSMYRVFTLYKYGTPRVAKDSFMPGTCQAEPVNYANVDSLNKCVAANLTPNDVWRNYFYNGSIWVNMDGLTEAQQDSLIIAQGFNIGNAQTGDVVRGSLSVSNITMETYLQTFADQTQKIFTYNATSIANCFGCHTGSAGITFNDKSVTATSPLFVSHIFRNFVSSTAAPGPKATTLAAKKGKLRKLTIDEAKQQGVRDFLNNLKRKQQK
jgi:hypothetical protein